MCLDRYRRLLAGRRVATNTPYMRRAVVVIAAIGVLAGCASSSDPSPTAPTTSPATSPTSLGEVDGIPIPGPEVSVAIPVILAPTSCPSTLPALLPGSYSVTSRHSSYLLICTYQNRHPVASACTKAEVEINTDPQAFKAFQRWTVETGQNSMWSHNPALNPRPVNGIGVEAEWVPATQTFEASTMNTWVAVFLRCPIRTPRDKPLAAALGRAGLAATS
jgi:hypothetical protein